MNQQSLINFCNKIINISELYHKQRISLKKSNDRYIYKGNRFKNNPKYNPLVKIKILIIFSQ